MSCSSARGTCSAQHAAQLRAGARGARLGAREHRFQIGVSNSGTTAVDTLRDGCGVCRDFAHTMISYCRALNYPARFVTGVDYGADPSLGPPDFHAYVEVMIGGSWYLFDADRHLADHRPHPHRHGPRCGRRLVRDHLRSGADGHADRRRSKPWTIRPMASCCPCAPSSRCPPRRDPIHQETSQWQPATFAATTTTRRSP